MPEEVSTNTAGIKGLATAVALLFLGSALSAWSEGKALSDQRVYSPAIIAIVALIFAYLPSERLKTARFALSTWASSIWVWATWPAPQFPANHK